MYASTNYIERRQLWLDLIQVKSQNIPWVAIGDFDAVIKAYEKRGGPPLASLFVVTL